MLDILHDVVDRRDGQDTRGVTCEHAWCDWMVPMFDGLYRGGETVEREYRACDRCRAAVEGRTIVWLPWWGLLL